MSKVVKNGVYLCARLLQNMAQYSKFLQFLEEKGCWKEFHEAFEAQMPGYHLDPTLWDIMVGDEFFFGRVFDWELTPQGRDFWAKIDQEWYELVIKVNR